MSLSCYSHCHTILSRFQNSIYTQRQYPGSPEQNMLHLELTTRKTGDFVYRSALLSKGSAFTATKLTYRIAGECVPERPRAMDGFAFAVILNAMKQGKPLHVHGPMTRTAMYNLEELQQAWSLWRPDLYKHIDISVDTIIDKPPPVGNRAILAFSGGLDSTFSALRHRLKLAGSGSYDVRSVLMVQGFDIGRDNDDFFKKAVERAQKFLDVLSLDMRLIATNSLNPLFQDWEDSHGAELACCLHQYSDEFAYGLIGSTKPYNGLVLPYGSNPATDHLLSGSGFSIVHEGSGFSRTAKAALVAKYDFAMSQLRVCYQGKLQYRNCGKCEKCMRTYLNFLAVGVERPLCFDVLPDLAEVARIKTHSLAQLAELISIVEFAKRRNITAQWLEDLQRSIDVYSPPSKASRMREKMLISAKRLAAKTLGYVGLRRPIKRMLHRMYENSTAPLPTPLRPPPG
jgi:hypothetical protein